MSKSKRALVAVLVAFVVGGCAKAADKSPAALSRRLLDITEMPGEWQETQRDVFTQRGLENPSIDSSTWCPDARGEAGKLGVLVGDAGADVEMQMQVDGEEMSRMMRLQAWRNDSARDYFAEIVTLVNMCDDAKWIEDSDVAQETWKIDGPEVGDEAVSWGSQVVPPEVKGLAVSGSRTTVARMGEVIMVLQIGESTASSSTSELSDADWREIVQRAADKLADG